MQLAEKCLCRIPACLGICASIFLASCAALPCRPYQEASREEKSRRISTELEKIRNLELKQPVPVAVMSRDELKTVLEKELEKSWEEEGAGLEWAYKLFGLIPEDIDLQPWLRDFMQTQIAAFYHVEEKSFFTVESGSDDLDGPKVEDFVFAHELTHAIEDQHFDFESARKSMKMQEDAQIAYESLIEGSAVETGIEHAIWREGAPFSTAGCMGRVLAGLVGRMEAGGLARMSEGQGGEMDSFAQAPPFVQKSLIFPYLKGWRLVNGVRAEFGWQGVDEAYRDPPESSEQVIHPERYTDRRDRPVVITVSDPLPEFSVRHEGTLGMLGMEALFEMNFGERAVRYAEGWDGDRYVLWESPAGRALGWVSVWDTERQAARFEKHYRRLLAGRGDEAGEWAIRREGPTVAVVQGALGEKAGPAVDRLIASRAVAAPDDAPPETALHRLLLWPAAVRPLDRVWEARLLGGLLVDTRFHKGGFRLRLADSLLLHTERSPDRFALWSLLGRAGGTRDDNLGFSYLRLPFVIKVHRRDSLAGHESRALCSLAMGAVSYVRRAERRHVRLLWGVLYDGQWGGTEGTTARLLLVPVPAFPQRSKHSQL